MQLIIPARIFHIKVLLTEFPSISLGIQIIMWFYTSALLTLLLTTSAFAADLRGAQDQRELTLATCTKCPNGTSGQCMSSVGVCWAAVGGVCPHYAPTPCGGTAPAPAKTGCDLADCDCLHDGVDNDTCFKYQYGACPSHTTACNPVPAKTGCDLADCDCLHDGVDNDTCFKYQYGTCPSHTTACNPAPVKVPPTSSPTMCDPHPDKCINTAKYGGEDCGCSEAEPVCAIAGNEEPAVYGGGKFCRKCINDYPYYAIDTGCDKYKPKCYKNAAGYWGCKA
jgi:hypothetical protein